MALVQQLTLFPVKGCRGVVVPMVRYRATALEADRRYVIVKADDSTLVTQLTCPDLAAIELSLDAAQWVLRHRDSGSLRIRGGEAPAVREVVCRTRKAYGNDCGDEVGAWLSAILGYGARLVDLARAADPHEITEGLPITAICAASISELARRMEAAVDIRRFRANLVISTSEPFEEDAWRVLRVGASLFTVQPRTLCPVINVDNDQGTRGAEPLRTLSRFRRMREGPNDIVFGINLTPFEVEGTLEAGASVEQAD